MSPRRSSRARATNQPLSNSLTNNSSSSSLSSGRERRSQRQPAASPPHSHPRSQSLDDTDDVKPPPRRTRSGHDGGKEAAEPTDPEPDPEPEDEEEEVTRCICGQMEYPGLPTPLQDEEKQRAKQGGAATPDELADDGSGIFIQCDICKVWQHGGCVGILDDDSAPEEYFCEQCRKDLHKVSTTATGQKFSRYKPVREDPSPNRSPPPTTRESARKAAKESKPRASAEALMAKRRPTINSYDEQEQLRRAIEESKKDGIVVGEKKRGKRSRDASEEEDSPSKRQRTGSNSSFPEPEKSNALSSSDEALIDLKPDGKTRSSRIREKEVKEQKERERVERERAERPEPASTKRRPRTDRRRAGEGTLAPVCAYRQTNMTLESDTTPAEPDPGAVASTRSSPPAPRSPQASITSISRHPKKNAPVQNKLPKARRGEGVRSQTSALRERERERQPSALQHALDPKRGLESGMRTRSRSRSRAPESPNGENGVGGANGTVHVNGSGMNGHGAGHGANGLPSLLGADAIAARPSRPKHMNPNRTSMNEMKKRVAGILEFVTKAQEEHARRNGGKGGKGGKGDAMDDDGPADAAAKADSDTGDDKPAPAVKLESERDPPTLEVNGADACEEFAALQTAEMMRVLRERLVGWESEYGRWGKAAS